MVEPNNYIPNQIAEGTLLNKYRVMQLIDPPGTAIYQSLDITNSDFVTLKIKSSQIKN